MKKLLFAVIIIFLFLSGVYYYLRSQLQDDSIPLANSFSGEKAMFIFPHPDDEITSAGTLKLLDKKGIETSLITFSHGEAGWSNGLVNEQDSVKRRFTLGKSGLKN
ncbi:PIG-L deacetylase family protein [Emticicia sp. BO119]|uniref:PIG-L deacetylase family protein n=1 Tax=Emticicia sp. BO119 TaxID=2757768 RepID=UPI0015F10A7C|nr:PIG-L family deacetylase [Emticicia sp. BO119]MBA4850226.1 PIG-L family deacetylase [Emticicia sp. BO119]